MTIALVFRYGKNAVILNDFRVTHLQGQQIDAMMKFAHFGNRMGLHVAGDVSLWKTAIPVIQRIEPQVNMSNILDPQGPMQRSLETLLMSNPTGAPLGTPMGAIGVILDTVTNDNEVFNFYGQAGMGCTISPVTNYSCLVIGSGKNVPNLDSILEHAARTSLSNNTNMSVLAGALELTLKQTIARCGASTYSALGISPIFATSLISGSSFYMEGGRQTGGNYSTNFNSRGYAVPTNYDYTFTRKLGRIVFRDHLAHETTFISDVMTYTEQSTSLIFDPQALTTGFDPSLNPCTNDVVYIINQWVSDDFIVRSVDRTFLIKHKDKVFCSPEYLRLADGIVENMPRQQRACYKMSGAHCLIVSEPNQKNFETGLASHLFDHGWLQSLILNYSDLYVQ